MKNNITIIYITILLLIGIKANGQEVTGKVGNSYRIQLNKFSLPVSNDGNLVWANEPTSGTFDRIPFLFSGGFVLGGLNNDNIWVRGQSFLTYVWDFVPGKIGDSQNPDNQLYVIKSSDQPFGKSWIDWIDAVKLGARFYDGDRNGKYEPIDKNSNGKVDFDEDMPDLLGDITAWCVYNDGGFFHLPQDIEVAQTIFGSSSRPYLRNVLFIRYAITYRGSNSHLDSVYFSIAVDPDLGENNLNNKAGCDKDFKISYAYKDTLDNDVKKIPFFFTAFIQGPEIYTGNPCDKSTINNGELIGRKQNQGFTNLSHSSFFNFPAPDLFPNQLSERQIYNLMKGRDVFGDQFIPCEFNELSNFVNVNCDTLNPYFMYDGNPFTPNGWIMKNSIDVRMLSNIGPFTIKKDTAQEIIIAYAIGSSQSSLADAFNNGRQFISFARSEYDENFSGLTYSNFVRDPEPKVWKYYHLSQNFPNPFNPVTKIAYEIPRNEFVKLKVYNSLGEEVITLVDENRSPGRYEIEFDGSSLTSGIYLYRIDAGGFLESHKMILLK